MPFRRSIIPVCDRGLGEARRRKEQNSLACLGASSFCSGDQGRSRRDGALAAPAFCVPSWFLAMSLLPLISSSLALFSSSQLVGYAIDLSRVLSSHRPSCSCFWFPFHAPFSIRHFRPRPRPDAPCAKVWMIASSRPSRPFLPSACLRVLVLVLLLQPMSPFPWILSLWSPFALCMDPRSLYLLLSLSSSAISRGACETNGL